MDFKVIKPASEKLVVRDPKSKKILDPKGEKKKLTSYWRRRLKDGSVVECKTKKVEVLEPKPELMKESDK